MPSLDFASFVVLFAVVPSFRNLLIFARESRVLEWSIGEPVKHEETEADCRQRLDDEEVLPLGQCCALNMPYTVCDETAKGAKRRQPAFQKPYRSCKTDSPSESSWAQEPEDAQTHLAPKIPQTEVVKDTSTEKTLSYANEYPTYH